MRCFQCSNTSCPLSGKKKSIEILPCPTCRNTQMVLRNKKSGGYFIGCPSFSNERSCGNVIWMPDTVKEVRIMEPCRLCAQRGAKSNKVRIEFSNNDLPLETCLQCDQSLRSHPDWSWKSNSAQDHSPKFRTNTTRGPLHSRTTTGAHANTKKSPKTPRGVIPIH